MYWFDQYEYVKKVRVVEWAEDESKTVLWGENIKCYNAEKKHTLLLGGGNKFLTHDLK